jgi:hypothetical protein
MGADDEIAKDIHQNATHPLLDDARLDANRSSSSEVILHCKVQVHAS